MTSTELLPATVLKRKAVVLFGSPLRRRSRAISRASDANTSSSMSRGNEASATSR